MEKCSGVWGFMKVMSEQNIHLDWQSLYWEPNIYQSYATGYVEEQFLMRFMILVAKRSGKSLF